MRRFRLRRLNSAKSGKESPDEVLARLAAGEVVSTWSGRAARTANADKDFVIRRIGINIANTIEGPNSFAFQRLGPQIMSQGMNAVMGQMADELCEVIMRGRINVNFHLKDFFTTKPADVKYLNIHERSAMGIANPGHGGVKDRERIENHFFGYSHDAGQQKGVGDLKNPATPYGHGKTGEDAASSRINVYGSGRSKRFSPVMRPRFASMNYADVRGGVGGEAWGKGLFVLSDRVKARCTLLARDMYPETNEVRQNLGPGATQSDFRAAAAERVATWDNPMRLLRYMSDGLFQSVMDTAQMPRGWTSAAKFQAHYNLHQHDYVECQIHMPLNLRTDCDYILLKTDGARKDHLKNIRDFCKQNSIRLETY